MLRKFVFDGFTIVVDFKSLKNSYKNDVEIYVGSNEKDIVIPKYYLHDNDAGANSIFLISHGFVTLMTLKRIAINKIMEQKKKSA